MDAANSLSTTGSIVMPMVGYYSVTLADGTHHLIDQEKRECREHGLACNAVKEVRTYLRNGGTRATPPDAKYLLPITCPICGGKVRQEPRLTTKVRGMGWICEAAAEQEHLAETGLPDRQRIYGQRHYWQAIGMEMSHAKKQSNA